MLTASLHEVLLLWWAAVAAILPKAGCTPKSKIRFNNCMFQDSKYGENGYLLAWVNKTVDLGSLIVKRFL